MRRFCCFLRPGRDAAGALAPRWPQDEEGGGHGPGHCQRDHDSHALPSERDHHLHLQTGTTHHSVPKMMTKLNQTRKIQSAVLSVGAVTHVVP